jgi:gliding motility-associated lipoprotein GldH
MRYLNTSFYAGMLAAAWLPVACAPLPAFEQEVKLPADSWNKDSTVRIAMPVEDVTKTYSIILTLRNHDNYSYRNIYLFVEAASPTGETVCDTVQYELVDAHGRWLGNQGYRWIDHRLLYRSRVRFADAGEYTFRIRHGMRTDMLPDIRSVGIRLESTDISD